MESRLLRWVACSDFIDLHKQFMEESKSRPGNSTFAYLADLGGEGSALRRLQVIVRCTSTTSWSTETSNRIAPRRILRTSWNSAWWRSLGCRYLSQKRNIFPSRSCCELGMDETIVYCPWNNSASTAPAYPRARAPLPWGCGRHGS